MNKEQCARLELNWAGFESCGTTRGRNLATTVRTAESRYRSKHSRADLPFHEAHSRSDM